MRTITIGDKPLSQITAEELMDIIVIEGCCSAVEHWGRPNIIEFDNQMFSDTLVLDYMSVKEEDGSSSVKFTIFFDFEKLQFHVDREGYPNNRKLTGRIRIETLNYLISKGYNVPITQL